MYVYPCDGKLCIGWRPGQPVGDGLLKLMIWKRGERIGWVIRPEGWYATIVPTADADELHLAPLTPLTAQTEAQNWPFNFDSTNRQDLTGWHWITYGLNREELERSSIVREEDVPPIGQQK